MTMLWTVIGLSLAWAAFPYTGYPALLWLLEQVSPRPVHGADVYPPISVVIAVHNGDKILREKLEATLALDYPRESDGAGGPRRFEVIVASDGSTDASDEIARSFAERGVVLVRNEPRSGKEAAQAAAIERASGEILIFTDVTAELSPDALRRIVRPFADASVGSVSSEDRVDSSGGEGAYVRFEMALRRLESNTTSLVGLSGSFFAVRRSLCEPWAPDLASDFRTALETARRGLRAVCEPSATARFRATDDVAAEWTRKVRTVRRGIAVLLAYSDLLHPRHGRIAFSLWGHKAARFTAPFALLGALGASAIAAPHDVWAAALLTAQLVAYAVGALALHARPVASLLLPRLAGFFLLVNASVLTAWFYHLSGRRAVVWRPTRR
jgi:cellulose synthase/poly-beta-1,6-N-acetylglucosamine synthase-like glycosyltransferase